MLFMFANIVKNRRGEYGENSFFHNFNDYRFLIRVKISIRYKVAVDKAMLLSGIGIASIVLMQTACLHNMVFLWWLAIRKE